MTLSAHARWGGALLGRNKPSFITANWTGQTDELSSGSANKWSRNSSRSSLCQGFVRICRRPAGSLRNREEIKVHQLPAAEDLTCVWKPTFTPNGTCPVGIQTARKAYLKLIQISVIWNKSIMKENIKPSKHLSPLNVIIDWWSYNICQDLKFISLTPFSSSFTPSHPTLSFHDIRISRPPRNRRIRMEEGESVEGGGSIKR